MPPASLSAKPRHEARAEDGEDGREPDPPRRRAGERADAGASGARSRRPPAVRVPRSISPPLPAEDARQALLPGRRDDGVDRVVDGDDPDEAALVVDDRHGQQVVAGDDLGDLVLVGEDADRDRLVGS